MIIMGLLDDLYNTGRAIVSGIANGVGSLFNWAATGLYNAFNQIANFIRTAVNWAWQGFDAIWRGIQNAVSGLATVLSNIYEWFMSQLRNIYNMLMALLDDLFRLTEDMVMKYGAWQSKLQMSLESGILGGCQDP